LIGRVDTCSRVPSEGSPHGFEGTHGLGCSSDALVNIIIIAQTKGKIGAEVFKVAAEGDLSVGDRDRSSLFKVM